MQSSLESPDELLDEELLEDELELEDELDEKLLDEELLEEELDEELELEDELEEKLLDEELELEEELLEEELELLNELDEELLDEELLEEKLDEELELLNELDEKLLEEELLELAEEPEEELFNGKNVGITHDERVIDNNNDSKPINFFICFSPLYCVHFYYNILCMFFQAFLRNRKKATAVTQLCDSRLYVLPIFYIHAVKRVSIIKNPKLNAENTAKYRPPFLGLCFTYSRKVIRLANEAINVPTPPIFTPKSKCL